jgi:hypothetical protein
MSVSLILNLFNELNKIICHITYRYSGLMLVLDYNYIDASTNIEKVYPMSLASFSIWRRILLICVTRIVTIVF